MNIPNFPTTNDDYEYTDEDFIKDTQPFWAGIEVESQEYESLDADDEFYEYNDLSDETNDDDEEYVEPDPYRKLPDIGFDWGRLDADDRMRLLDQMRNSESGLYDENPYSYDSESLDEADWRFDNLDENRTPEGWFSNSD